MTIDLERLAVDADYWDEVAPEGATHFMYSEKFVKWVDGVEWVFYTSSDKAWKQATLTWPLQKYTDNGNEVIAKPKSHPTDMHPAESGAQISADWVNGIPPIGWYGECTWESNLFWYQCVILPDRKIAIDFVERWEVRPTPKIKALNFRPIRSQAERERKELATFLEDYHLEMGSYWCPEKEANYILSSYDVAKKARGES
jgi:hypothetical protein